MQVAASAPVPWNRRARGLTMRALHARYRLYGALHPLGDEQPLASPDEGRGRASPRRHPAHRYSRYSCSEGILDAAFRRRVRGGGFRHPAARDAHGQSGWADRAALEDALFAFLPRCGVALGRLGARRLSLTIGSPAARARLLRVARQVDDLVAELKFDEVQQRLWDVVKLLAARKLSGHPDALL